MANQVGQELLNVPFPEMVKNLALAIAEGQTALDQNSIEVAKALAEEIIVLPGFPRPLTIPNPNFDPKVAVGGTNTPTIPNPDKDKTPDPYKLPTDCIGNFSYLLSIPRGDYRSQNGNYNDNKHRHQCDCQSRRKIQGVFRLCKRVLLSQV